VNKYGQQISKSCWQVALVLLQFLYCSTMTLSSAGFFVSGGETWNFSGSCDWDWFVIYPNAFVMM